MAFRPATNRRGRCGCSVPPTTPPRWKIGRDTRPGGRVRTSALRLPADRLDATRRRNRCSPRYDRSRGIAERVPRGIATPTRAAGRRHPRRGPLIGTSATQRVRSSRQPRQTPGERSRTPSARPASSTTSRCTAGRRRHRTFSREAAARARRRPPRGPEPGSVSTVRIEVPAGWADIDDAVGDDGRPFPAGAGINPIRCGQNAPRHDTTPHRRGSTQHERPRQATSSGHPPHARGSTVGILALGVAVAKNPARAGVNPTTPSGSGANRTPPRGRGGQPGDSAALPRGGKKTPRTRGPTEPGRADGRRPSGEAAPAGGPTPGQREARTATVDEPAHAGSNPKPEATAGRHARVRGSQPPWTERSTEHADRTPQPRGEPDRRTAARSSTTWRPAPTGVDANREAAVRRGETHPVSAG